MTLQVRFKCEQKCLCPQFCGLIAFVDCWSALGDRLGAVLLILWWINVTSVLIQFAFGDGSNAEPSRWVRISSLRSLKPGDRERTATTGCAFGLRCSVFNSVTTPGDAATSPTTDPRRHRIVNRRLLTHCWPKSMGTGRTFEPYIARRQGRWIRRG